MAQQGLMVLGQGQPLNYSHGCHGGHGFVGTPFGSPIMSRPMGKPLTGMMGTPPQPSMSYVLLVKNPTTDKTYLVLIEPKPVSKSDPSLPTAITKRPTKSNKQNKPDPSLPTIITKKATPDVTEQNEEEIRRLRAELTRLQQLQEISRLKDEINRLKLAPGLAKDEKEIVKKPSRKLEDAISRGPPLGKEYGGKKYQHSVYAKDWKGYSKTHKSEALQKTLYYSPKDGCWYYRNEEGIFLPLGE